MLSLQEIKKNRGRSYKHNTVEHQHGHDRELRNIQDKVTGVVGEKQRFEIK